MDETWEEQDQLIEVGVSIEDEYSFWLSPLEDKMSLRSQRWGMSSSKVYSRLAPSSIMNPSHPFLVLWSNRNDIDEPAASDKSTSCSRQPRKARF